MDYTEARQHMVDGQVRPNGVTDPGILQGMEQVQRELFVPLARRNLAYVDADLVLGEGPGGRALMAALPFARMLQAASISGQDKVLIVGVNTGYSAAVVAKMATHVVGLESDAALLQQATINLKDIQNLVLINGALGIGHAEAGPYTVILIEGAIERLPVEFGQQLVESGRLIVFQKQGPIDRLMVGTVERGSLSWRSIGAFSVASLPGFGPPVGEFVF